MKKVYVPEIFKEYEETIKDLRNRIKELEAEVKMLKNESRHHIKVRFTTEDVEND